VFAITWTFDQFRFWCSFAGVKASLCKRLGKGGGGKTMDWAALIIGGLVVGFLIGELVRQWRKR